MSLPDRNERGAVTVELVVIVPALIIMLGLLIAGGRIWFAKSTVAQAAGVVAPGQADERIFRQRETVFAVQIDEAFVMFHDGYK